MTLPVTTRVIGVIADTHVPHRIAKLPDSVFAALRGCDVILHAGDLEDPAILPQLATLAPIHAVRGNLHWQFSTGTHDQDLPLALTVRVGVHELWMTHGHFDFARTVVDKATGYLVKRRPNQINEHLIRRLRQMRPPTSTVVIFGHSHLSAAQTIDGVLYFNPGSVAAQARKYREGARVGRLLLDGTQVTPQWIDL